VEPAAPESSPDDLEQRLARLEQQDQRLTRALELLAPPPRRRDWDAYAAVIASLIGLLALAVSGYTAYVQRQQLRAQVWPHLQVLSSDVRTEPRYFVANAGTGPARISAVRITIDGVAVKDRAGLFKAAGFDDSINTVWSTLSSAVLPAGKELTFLQSAPDDHSRDSLIALMHGNGHTLGMTVCYCSVLDECWVDFRDTRSNGPATQPCPIRDAERFTD
jgi:hypothetical protein